MFGKWLFALVAPLALAVTLSACNDSGVQPGVVRPSAAGGYRGEAGRVVVDPRGRPPGTPGAASATAP